MSFLQVIIVVVKVCCCLFLMLGVLTLCVAALCLLFPLLFLCLFLTVVMVLLFMEASGGQVRDFKCCVGLAMCRFVLLKLGFAGHWCC